MAKRELEKKRQEQVKQLEKQQAHASNQNNKKGNEHEPDEAYARKISEEPKIENPNTKLILEKLGPYKYTKEDE